MSGTLQFSVPLMICYLGSYCAFLYQKDHVLYSFNSLNVALLSANLIGMLQVASLKPQKKKKQDPNIPSREPLIEANNSKESELTPPGPSAVGSPKTSIFNKTRN
eukprot:TRINITY_DN23179_c0_g1_i1.p1 TRINITY_DN23179_c0_g1~~TRINITY_DN23179_c0_g1_i1.p1  ORF type:complete len:117 (+),score=27.19 TRINITY_DN23179_c0_g1_i1:37-351(+)